MEGQSLGAGGDGQDRGEGGGGEAKKRKKSQKNHKRDVGNGADLDERRKYVDKSIGSVDVNPEDLENIKEAGREA